MCTQSTFEQESRSRRRLALSRRGFNLAAVSAAAVAMLPARAAAVALGESAVQVATPDGTMDAYFVRPASGKAPGVVMWPDFMSLRPAYEQLARRLAESGYAVLVVNPFYRSAKAPLTAKADLDDKALVDKVMKLMNAISPEQTAADARASAAFLDQQAAVDGSRGIGTMGYCMGGRFALMSAAAAPERVRAVAAFHAGGLVTDKPSSPHLQIPKMRAQMMLAIAENDDQRQPEAKTVLRDAFAAAKLEAEIKVYAGTQHGWCTPDMTSVYHPAQAQAAWERMLVLFERALKAV